MRTRQPFIVIPVLDLLRGNVVRAQAGRRAEYRPLMSPLCNSSRAEEVIRAFRRLHPFPVVYIADLDAIQRTGDNRGVVEALRAGFPDLELWVDAGIATPDDWLPWRSRGVRPVIGSESQTGRATAEMLLAALAPDNPVLSLDFMGGRFLGPAELLREPGLWPERVIVMTLDRVGENAGPDLNRLSELHRLVPGKQLFAAGGVRDGADLLRLRGIGIQGALIASALHAGRIGGRELDEIVRDDH